MDPDPVGSPPDLVHHHAAHASVEASGALLAQLLGQAGLHPAGFGSLGKDQEGPGSFRSVARIRGRAASGRVPPCQAMRGDAQGEERDERGIPEPPQERPFLPVATGAGDQVRWNPVEAAGAPEPPGQLHVFHEGQVRDSSHFRQPITGHQEPLIPVDQTGEALPNALSPLDQPPP